MNLPITLLRTKIVQLSDGVMVVSGTTISSVVKSFEAMFGKARQQKVPCHAAVQQEWIEVATPWHWRGQD